MNNASRLAWLGGPLILLGCGLGSNVDRSHARAYAAGDFALATPAQTTADAVNPGVVNPGVVNPDAVNPGAVNPDAGPAEPSVDPAAAWRRFYFELAAREEARAMVAVDASDAAWEAAREVAEANGWTAFRTTSQISRWEPGVHRCVARGGRLLVERPVAACSGPNCRLPWECRP